MVKPTFIACITYMAVMLHIVLAEGMGLGQGDVRKLGREKRVKERGRLGNRMKMGMG